jgi:hypothetical protein
MSISPRFALSAAWLSWRLESKDKVQHGDWGPLINRLGWSRDTADRYIRAYVVFGAAGLKHLPQSAIYLMAAPSTPVHVRNQIVQRAQIEKLAYMDVKAAIDKAKPQPTRDKGGDDFAGYDPWNGEICGFAQKGRGGQINIFIEDKSDKTGGRKPPELWFSIVPSGKQYSQPVQEAAE